ncbi:MAG: sodium:proton antiporter [Candidatus Omnitrophica bacterium]|nr:sodium:proton antiporter [Candidatus Omnitrophota bacterium]
MIQVLIYSALLIAGMIGSQIFNLSAIAGSLTLLTMVCLAYIMIEVGLEFTIDKKNLKSYGTDYLVAATAASFPWIFCAVYFVWIFNSNWKEALLIGRFAAPTSAGVLFTMLAAAGLASTWIYKKARILAIFDDLDTVLFMIPLKILIVGLKPELGLIVIIIFLLLLAAYKWLHVLRIPTGKGWLLFYGVLIAGICDVFYKKTDVHFEVLLPAFVLGCMIYFPHKDAVEDHEISKVETRLDHGVKYLFMFLVGMSLPKIDLAGLSWQVVGLHVLALTVLSNLGKCYASFCYKKEAGMKERIALSVAMFPRGEVGAGVLLVSIGYGLTGFPVTVAALSLALNLLLTGVFIAVIMKLIKHEPGKTVRV